MRGLPSARRATGDELIADLFEAMHELHFAQDAIEAGDFVLALVMAMLPSRAGIVHLYDIDHREFVIACTLGDGMPDLLLRRHPEAEPLLSAAMRKRRALVFEDARTEETAAVDRFKAFGGAKSLIVSPVMLAGRFLGVIEIANATDGLPFTEKEGNAIDYISEQFAEFVASRGVVLDPERIVKAAAR
jgi:GAF domain-containing protein